MLYLRLTLEETSEGIGHNGKLTARCFRKGILHLGCAHAM